jgi:glutathione S-transferase
LFTLYYAPNTIALAVHIVLEQAGAPYRAVRLDFRISEQRDPDYLAINAKGRVPALATPRGVLTETPAILTFLAQSFPEKGLAPLDDPFAFGRVQAFMAYLCSTVHPARAHGVRGGRWADDPAAIAELRRKAPEVVSECLELIEWGMFAGPWVMSGGYTICDPYLYTFCRWLAPDGLDIRRWPKLAGHFARMDADPVVRAVLDQELAPAH